MIRPAERIRRARAVTVAAVAAVAAVGPPVPAAAGSQARFRVALRGSQSTTWHLASVAGPGACAPHNEADGDQLIRFRALMPGAVTVTRSGGAAPVFGEPVAVSATVQRSASASGTRPVMDGRRCVGTQPLPPVPFPGCGSRAVGLRVRLGFSAAAVSGDPEDEFSAPLVQRPDQLRLRGVAPDPADDLRPRFPGCPLMEPDAAYPPAAGELDEAVAHLSEHRLMSPRTRVIRLAADHTSRFAVGPIEGKTIVTYNLTLTRVPSQRRP